MDRQKLDVVIKIGGVVNYSFMPGTLVSNGAPVAGKATVGMKLPLSFLARLLRCHLKSDLRNCRTTQGDR